MQVNDSERCKMMQEERNMKKMRKKVQEKFAGSEKVPTFAIPLRNKGITLRPRVEWGESEKERRKPLSMTEFIEKTGTKVQGSKYQTQKNRER